MKFVVVILLMGELPTFIISILKPMLYGVVDEGGKTIPPFGLDIDKLAMQFVDVEVELNMNICGGTMVVDELVKLYAQNQRPNVAPVLYNEDPSKILVPILYWFLVPTLDVPK